MIKYVLRAIKWLSVAALLAVTAALVTCGASDESYVKRLTGLEIKQGSIRLWKDTHGGFLGDGVTAAIIDYGMKSPKGWDELPLPGDLSALSERVFRPCRMFKTDVTFLMTAQTAAKAIRRSQSEYPSISRSQYTIPIRV